MTLGDVDRRGRLEGHGLRQLARDLAQGLDHEVDGIDSDLRVRVVVQSDRDVLRIA